MYKIGITGSIGTGKTTVANMFTLFKIPVFNADNEIKKIFENKEVIQKLKMIFPEVIKKNNIDKRKLKTIIFSNKNEKKKLEDLLYPYLEIEKNKFLHTNREENLVYDAAYYESSQKSNMINLLTNCIKITKRKSIEIK